MEITIDLVKKLRDNTGISIMQCKHALEEAGGDIDKALAILKKTGSEIANKKAGRELKDGRITIKIKDKKAIIATLLCETDFVSKNEDFISLSENIIDKIDKEGLESIKINIKESIDPIIQKTGENIALGEVYEIKGEVLGSYNHNNKKGAVVSLTGGSVDLAKDIAMHITAMNPEYIKKEEITDETKKMMLEIFEKEIANIDKPKEIKDKMLQGKINTYFKEKTLLEQSFIKNQDQTIEKLLLDNKADIKEVRYCFI